MFCYFLVFSMLFCIFVIIVLCEANVDDLLASDLNEHK